jgi:hypothetical protein
VLAGLGVRKDRGRLGGHAGAERQRGLAAFQGGELAFGRLNRRVQSVARVEVALASPLHDVEQVGRAVEGEGGVVVERRMDRAFGVTRLAGVDAMGRDPRVVHVQSIAWQVDKHKSTSISS